MISREHYRLAAIHTAGLFFSAVLLSLLIAACGKENGTSSSQPIDPRASRLVHDARDAFNNRNFVQALSFADSALTISSDHTDASFLKGRIYFELSQLDSAETAYQHVALLNAEYPGLWHNLGNISFRRKQYREALKRYHREIDNHPAANPWHGLGGTYEALGIADSARHAYEQAVTIDTRYAPAFSSLADLHERDGDFDAALANAQSALSVDSTNLAYRFQVGNLLVRTGSPEEAIDKLESVVEQQPWNYSAWFSLGRALQRTGDTARADEILQQANRIRSEQSEIDRLRRSAQSDPSNFQKKIAYADALRNTARIEDAVGAYLVALSLRPNNLALQNNIATLFLQSGREAEALARYQHIVSVDSTFGEAWINLAAYHAREGNNELAQEAWDKALLYAPDHPAVRSLRNRLGE